MSDKSYDLFGWILFILSAMAFMVSSYRAGDWWAFSGGLLFFIACWVFIYPIWRSGLK